MPPNKGGSTSDPGLRQAVRFEIYGRVQGVAYRWFTKRAALELGLKGWVRNRPDGSVEVEAQGRRSELTLFRERLRTGPPAADVQRIEEQTLSVRHELLDFGVRR